MNKAILNHVEIEQYLPHAGNMSLLDEIIHSDSDSLTALAISHSNPKNPLRHNGLITTVNGIEYAAQAMAVHGALVLEHSSEQAPTGYIATIRNVSIKQPYLPQSKKPLLIKVEQLMSNNDGFTYEFHISCEQQPLISGKITVFLIHI